MQLTKKNSLTWSLLISVFLSCYQTQGICLDEQLLSVAKQRFQKQDFLGSEKCLRLIMNSKTFHRESIQDQAFIVNKLALCLDQQDKLKEGIVLHERALALLRQNRISSESEFLMVENNLANAYAKAKLFDKCIPLMLSNLERRKRVYGQDSIQLAVSYNNLGSAFQDFGKYQAAETNYLAALRIIQNTTGNKNDRFYSTLQNLADLYRQLGRYDDQLIIAKKMVKNAEESHTKNSVLYADSLDSLGSALKCNGKLAESIAAFKEAVSLKTRLLGESSNSVADSLNNLACSYLENGDIQLAIQPLEKSVRIFSELNGSTSKRALNAKKNLEQAIAAGKRKGKVIK